MIYYNLLCNQSCFGANPWKCAEELQRSALKFEQHFQLYVSKGWLSQNDTLA